MADRLIHADDLIKECGYFFCGEENNGYCCSHPENEEAPGCCYTWACPIAVEADIQDMRELDPGLAKEYEKEGKEGWKGEWTVGSGWMRMFDFDKEAKERER